MIIYSINQLEYETTVRKVIALVIVIIVFVVISVILGCIVGYLLYDRSVAKRAAAARSTGHGAAKSLNEPLTSDIYRAGD